uniref:Large ribosomal subunit protein uL4c n=1 Tax=Antithamnion hubbsii TaxID=1005974 RepID=A0A4D6WLH8_9FLOR|nr:ribosomal protein L4 [Antithamnion hubbsii]
MTEIKTLKYSIVESINEPNLNFTEIKLKISNDLKKNMYITHRVIKQQLHIQRQGNANTKTRSEVRGGGKKPWKQKGTGRARAGSIRSPLWKGGGVIFGPKPKKYTFKINKKERQLAIRILLYNKYSQTTITQNFCKNLKKPNTQNILESLNNLGIQTKNKNRVLIIVSNKSKALYLSIRNLTNIDIICANNLNTLSLIKADKILITFDALNIINTIYNDKS